VSAAVRIAVVGDALLDRDVEGSVERLCPDAPVPVVDLSGERARPGGAALAAVLTAADGHAVTLVTALGDDAAGAELRALVEGHGVHVVDLGLEAPTPEKLRVIAEGRSLIRLDRGERRPSAVGTAGGDALTAIASAGALLVADYGRGVAAAADLRDVLARAAAGGALVWDPHPDGPAPVAGAALVTPNAAEAARFAPEAGDGEGPTAAIGRGRALRERWSADAVAVTIGADGALLVTADGQPLLVPAAPARGGDPCGAGDRFASRVAGALAVGTTTATAVELAVAAASGFVDAGGAAAWTRRREATAGESAAPRSLGGGAVELAARERAVGRRVVATGGCFDLLHAGHVQMLQAARALGDTLIVCLNSDRSVAALKGESRPLVPQSARAAVLQALESVDAVLVFDEATPQRAIEDLRPDVWVKGGDYAEQELPEAGAVRACGGEVVLLPQLPGHSTTRLIEEAVRRDAA
jgi:rfaE bifunctional protein nucleotidyltransferase chain/domain/rfaE bifunctional protein kinase chain/domain